MKRIRPPVNCRNRITRLGSCDSSPQPLERLWALRLLVKGGAWNVAEQDMLQEIPGLSALADRLDHFNKESRDRLNTDPSLSAIERPAFKTGALMDYFRDIGLLTPKEADEVPQELTNALEAAERDRDQATFLSPFAENLALIQSIFKLSDNETRYAAFAIQLFRYGSLLNQIGRLFDCQSGLRMISSLFACATDLDETTAKSIVMDTKRRVHQLFDYSERGGSDPDDWGCALGPLSLEAFIGKALTRQDLQQAFFYETPAPKLAASDFCHVPALESTILPFLKNALTARRPGVNVLLYGAPGTGKTQLSRIIGHAIDARVLEVTVRPIENDRGRYQNTTSRLRAWENAGLCVESESRAIFVMDEAEDIFLSGLKFFGANTVRDNKAEINHLLETNPKPTIWLTNSLSGMDAAMLRRFDIILEVPQPTLPQRRSIINRTAGDLLSEDLKERLARTEKLTPGVLDKALSVVKLINNPSPQERDAKALELINAVLEVQKSGQVAVAAPLTETVYDTSFVNTDADLTAIAEGIRRRPSARLCLYGAPGTGKSAYAAWLATTLGKTLIIKKASDLLSMWVGGTEANIAKAFHEAQRENAVLLIDEADSFLQDRTRSALSWETTQVNEMLTQMEQFEGIFIATTNLVDTLDPAALRRFDLKAKFGFLRKEQTLALFARWQKTLQLAADVKAESRVAALSNLTPGDFAAAARQSQFNPLKSASDLAARLVAECRLKEENAGHGSVIGFC